MLKGSCFGRVAQQSFLFHTLPLHTANSGNFFRDRWPVNTYQVQVVPRVVFFLCEFSEYSHRRFIVVGIKGVGYFRFYIVP